MLEAVSDISHLWYMINESILALMIIIGGVIFVYANANYTGSSDEED